MSFSLLLVACTSGSRGPEDSSASSSGPVDTGTPTACGQTHPWVIEDAEDVGIAEWAGTSPWPQVVLYDGYVYELALLSGEPDPCIQVTVEGDVITVTGLCTTAGGVEISGTVVFTGSSDAGEASSTYEDLHFWNPGRGAGYDIDGGWTWSLDEAEVAHYATDLTATLLTSAGVWQEGTWRSTSALSSNGAMSEVGYVDITAQETSGATGDYCYTRETTVSDGCSAEHQGVATVTGTATGTLTWDGESDCDDCGDVAIDGRPIGQYCE